MRSATTLLLVLSLACTKQPAVEPAPGAQAHAGLPPVEDQGPPAAPAAHPASDARTVAGKVLERIDAPPYSYLRLQTAGGEQWAAVNQAGVKVGDEVTITNAMAMDGFESRTLKRKFDHIVFG